MTRAKFWLWFDRLAHSALAAWLLWHVVYAFRVAGWGAVFTVAAVLFGAFTLGSVRARHVCWKRFSEIISEEKE